MVSLRFYPDETFPSIDSGNTSIRLSLFIQEEQEAAFSLFSILAMAYVNNPTGEDIKQTEPIRLPATISVPLCKLSDQLKRKPIWDYAGCVLNNFKLVDKTKPVALDNIEILRTLTGLECESWFYKIHIVIEAYGGVAIEEILKIKEITKTCNMNIEKYKSDLTSFGELIDNIDKIIDSLEIIAAAIQMMKITFSEMSKHCKAREFFVVLRPWLKGWQSPGVIYTDVDEKPVIHGGGSGAQSSLLPSLDAFFGVSYMNKINPDSSFETTKEEDNDLKDFVKTLRRFRGHMPPEHVEFLQQLESEPSFRNFFALCNEITKNYFPSKDDPECPRYIPIDTPTTEITPSGQLSSEKVYNLPLFLKERQRMEVARLQNRLVDVKVSYNYAIENMLSFRRMHVGYATSYITRQAKILAESQPMSEEEKIDIKKKAQKGTGGSSFTKHFMSHIKDTRKCLFRVEGRPRNEHEVDAEMIRESDEHQSFKRVDSLREQVIKVRELRQIADIENNAQSDEE